MQFTFVAFVTKIKDVRWTLIQLPLARRTVSISAVWSILSLLPLALNNMKNILTFLALLTSAISQAQAPIGIFQTAADIGSPKNAGSTVYDPDTQAYTMKGGGYNIWFNRDEFQYAHNKIKGDFILTANFEFKSAGKDPHRKIGWMVRSSADGESAHVSAVLHGDGLISLQWRSLRGAYMRDPEDQIVFPKTKASAIQLERFGEKADHAGGELGRTSSNRWVVYDGQPSR